MGARCLWSSLVLAVLLAAPAAAQVGSRVAPWRTDGLSRATDVTPGIGFVGVSPCRIVDTRGPDGAYGGPILTQASTRSFDLNDGPCPGIPAAVAAYSLNVTATQTQGAGFLSIWPQGSTPPTVSTLNYVANETVANAAIVPAGTGGGISVVAGVSGTHLIIDIDGYFTADYNAGNRFRVIGDMPGGLDGAGILFVRNTNGASANSWGGHFQSDSCNTGSAGVFAEATSAPSCGAVFGVWGRTRSTFDGSAGVFGENQATSGRTYGVAGVTSMAPIGTGAAGVFGVAGAIPTVNPPTAGVRGVSDEGYGVFGITTSNLNGVAGAAGHLYPEGITGFLGRELGPNDYGVYSSGDYGGTGAKYFVEPHPQRADMVIRYVSLEGPEAGTYFRGRGKFVNGLATIEVPDDFRLVTDPDSLSVVVTPIGQMASFAIMRVGLDRIVVKGSRNVEFFYLVNGVRKTHRDLTPIVPGDEYMPDSAEATMPRYLTEGQKQMLISNGTYNPDGTANLETARRLGWDKAWAKRAGRTE
jgi:hypothetical protein